MLHLGSRSLKLAGSNQFFKAISFERQSYFDSNDGCYVINEYNMHLVNGKRPLRSQVQCLSSSNVAVFCNTTGGGGLVQPSDELKR